MNGRQDGETREELLQAARETGFAVSGSQLARWHRIGLLPKPAQRPLGKGRGTQSVYAPGTSRQLLALCAIHDKDRSLPSVGWRLWWEGYEVERAYARAPLIEAARQLNAWADVAADARRGGLSEAAWEQIDRSDTTRFGSKLLRQARRRIGRRNFPFAVRVMLEVFSGQFDGFYDLGVQCQPEETYVERALKVNGARFERLGGTGPWLVGSLDAPLRELSRRMGERPWNSTTEDLSDSELSAMKDELRTFIAALQSLRAFLASLFGPDAFGLAIAGAEEFTVQEWQPFLLLMWPTLRSMGDKAKVDALLETCRWWLGTVAPAIGALDAIRAELPEFAPLLGPSALRAALLNGKAADRLQERLIEAAGQHAERLEEFWRQQRDTRTVGQEP